MSRLHTTCTTNSSIANLLNFGLWRVPLRIWVCMTQMLETKTMNKQGTFWCLFRALYVIGSAGKNRNKGVADGPFNSYHNIWRSNNKKKSDPDWFTSYTLSNHVFCCCFCLCLCFLQGRGGTHHCQYDVTAIFKMAPKFLNGKFVNQVDFLLHYIIFLLFIQRWCL